MTDRDPTTRTEGETLDMPEGTGGFRTGQILGERYQILEMLGRGGMGEVWKAFDLKLRVEVALKALRPEYFKSERRLELLRQEVRAAREVMSPNVCRIFDLIEIEGRELVSMEYVGGATLLGVLHERGPLELKEAQDIASQFLAGLEAIHKVGLIHRDIKPENIMLTRAGRVVVMDFGLARQETEGGGSVSGTPAYMSPEQAAGQTLDARADVYAAGVVLAEMVSPDGIKSYESRQSVWEGLRSEPAKVPDSPWAPAIKKAVAKDREGRFNSAHTLTRALEDVTLRVEGAEDLRPYPGLASFTEEDAEYFFGREAEVEQMWRKLEGPPRLFAIMGPSGAGKSSFIAAGLVAHPPTDWGIIRSTPGNAAISSLGAAVARETAGDPDAVELLPRFDDPDIAVEVLTRWGQKSEHSLLIVDQFEEMFTQNSAEEQERFAGLLHRLVLEADIHILLSMRDDFAGSCNAHEPLRSIFQDMTYVDPPTGGNLRRALIRPAQKCGYRLEDDELVGEMLAEVEGERGALPLVAFAAAQLWERRDRESGLLTREAYQDISGVGGALAQHAESTIDRIGSENLPTVRELFRNLVTAEGTRAVREWNELLSIFSDSHSESQPEEVLRHLIDARLLTSYEMQEGDEAPTRRVEIIHESLLANWPRLVRWQIQDQEGLQLREELRQASKTWHDHGRPNDLLWTGTAYREFVVWRERYSGGLSQTEEAFAAAMSTLATRNRRRRRVAAVATLVLTLAVAGVFGTLWRRSVQETRRAEASKLLALAQVELDTDPTEALAYTTASLELADSPSARSFVMRVLWEAPPALELNPGGSQNLVPAFSPDGTYLAVSGISDHVKVWAEEGGVPVVLEGHKKSSEIVRAAWASNGLLVTTPSAEERARIWSFPGGELLRSIDLGGPAELDAAGDRLFAEVHETDAESGHEILRLRSWRLPDGGVEHLGAVDRTALGSSFSWFDPDGSGWFYGKENKIFYRPLPVTRGIPDQLVGAHQNRAAWVGFPTEPDHLWTRDAVTSELRLWDLSSSAEETPRVLKRPISLEEGAKWRPAGRSGRWAYSHRFSERHPKIWSLESWREARPLILRRSGSWWSSSSTFHPSGDWFVASTQGMARLTFWPVGRTRPSVSDGYSLATRPVVFSPDGKWLFTSWADGTIRLWPVPGSGSRESRVIELPKEVVATANPWQKLVVEPRGQFLVAVGYGDSAYIVPLEGSPPQRLANFSDDTVLIAAAVSPSGRRIATAFGGFEGSRTLRVLDLDTDELRLFALPESVSPTTQGNEGGIADLHFADEETLYSAGDGSVSRWDLGSGTHNLVYLAKPGYGVDMAVAADGRTAVIQVGRIDVAELISPAILDLATGAVRTLEAFVGCGCRYSFPAISIDASGAVVAVGDADGLIRVGRIDGSEPHLLVGHDGKIDFVSISPDGRWVASTGEDNTLRLWPMPDFSKPPLHTLPREELIEKLKTLTNLRVVRDEESSTGWKVEIGPFPGWAEVPDW